LKRKFFKFFFSLIIIFLIIVGFISLSFKQRINNRPLPSFYKKGAFHVHSSFSDGRGGIDEISRDAKRSNLDFVILTDHGRPNLPASAATGWINDILLIGASEFSLNEGHLAAAGYHIPTYIFPPEAQEAIDEVNRDRGVSFISHPLDRKIPWTGWQVRDFTGIEILSLYQLVKKVPFFKAAIFPLQYLFNSDYALTQLITYPAKESQLWDSLNKEGKYYGIYALDAHAKLEISRKFQLNFPAYAAMFKILTVYVKVENDLEKDPLRAAAAIVTAIRCGNFFNVIESLAPANGFENYYQEKDGRLVDMGGDAQTTGGNLIFKLPFNFTTAIVVKKDGKIFKTIKANNKQQLSIPISLCGVYRAEISLASGRFKKLPWIVANPIYIAQPAVEKKSPENAAGIILADRENYFRVEKNSRSSAVIYWDAQGEKPPITSFTFTLRHEASNQVDFWTALAHREKLDFSNYQGFVFETRGSGQMRFWLQLRTGGIGQGEATYQHSFLVKEQWRKIAIPFSSFHRLYGQTASPDPTHINAFFFLIDNGNAFPGTQGEIFFRQIGLY
jgi:hypothetical protein